MTRFDGSKCPLCANQDLADVFEYDSPPEAEIRFLFDYREYHRMVLRCPVCGHYISICDKDLTELYEDDYTSFNYSDRQGIRDAFQRIISLAPAESDNAGRVGFILDYYEKHKEKYLKKEKKPSVLDVGSGLCVFLYLMNKNGWECVALDPDERSAAHARETVGIEAICGDFFKVEVPGKFDLITFNKVLEHVKNPVVMLARAKEYLKDEGFVYVELPDGEAAEMDGPEREEFFIDHLHVFSAASLALLVNLAGFSLLRFERIREPSSKYTLRAFMCVPPDCLLEKPR